MNGPMNGRASRRRIALVVGLGALASWGHVGYPLVLGARSRRRRDPAPPPPGEWPGLSVVVPAYREEGVIAAKIADLRDNGYPGPLDVIVVSEDIPTADAARTAGAEVITSGERLGKAEALNLGVAAARQPVVVLTDANTTLEPGSLAALARWLGDPSITAVAGEKRVAGDPRGQGWFWRFESWLKRREARTGSTIGLVGELAAVRRSEFAPIPPDVAVDDLWVALDILEAGGRIAYEPAAVATEPAAGLAAEWERRTRIVCGTLDVAIRRRQLLRPSAGDTAFQLWGHRVMRSTLGPVAHAVLLAGIAAAAPRSRVARTVLAAHGTAAVSLLRSLAGAPTTAPERLMAQVLFLQLVGLGGTARYVRGDRPARWPKPAR